MSTEMKTTGIPTDILNDMQAVADAVASGHPVDPEVAKRIRERSEKVQEQLLHQYGVRQIAVGLIRQVREE